MGRKENWCIECSTEVYQEMIRREMINSKEKDKTKKDQKVIFIKVEKKYNRKKTETSDHVLLEEILCVIIQNICSKLKPDC